MSEDKKDGTSSIPPELEGIDPSTAMEILAMLGDEEKKPEETPPVDEVGKGTDADADEADKEGTDADDQAGDDSKEIADGDEANPTGDEGKDTTVPYAALKDERSKRQARDEENATLRAEIAALKSGQTATQQFQQAAPQGETPPDEGGDPP